MALDRIYRSPPGDDDKRKAKEAILAWLNRFKGSRPINNAMVSQHLTYQAGARGFPLLLEACRGDFGCFFARLRTLGPADFSAPMQPDVDALLGRLADSATD